MKNYYKYLVTNEKGTYLVDDMKTVMETVEKYGSDDISLVEFKEGVCKGIVKNKKRYNDCIFKFKTWFSHTFTKKHPLNLLNRKLYHAGIRSEEIVCCNFFRETLKLIDYKELAVTDENFTFMSAEITNLQEVGIYNLLFEYIGD